MLNKKGKGSESTLLLIGIIIVAIIFVPKLFSSVPIYANANMTGNYTGYEILFTSPGSRIFYLNVPTTDLYNVSISAREDHGGTDYAKMDVAIDGILINEYSIASNTSSNPTIVSFNQNLAAGAHTLNITFPNDYYLAPSTLTPLDTEVNQAYWNTSIVVDSATTYDTRGGSLKLPGDYTSKNLNITPSTTLYLEFYYKFASLNSSLTIGFHPWTGTSYNAYVLITINGTDTSWHHFLSGPITGVGTTAIAYRVYGTSSGWIDNINLYPVNPTNFSYQDRNLRVMNIQINSVAIVNQTQNQTCTITSCPQGQNKVTVNGICSCVPITANQTNQTSCTLDEDCPSGEKCGVDGLCLGQSDLIGQVTQFVTDNLIWVAGGVVVLFILIMVMKK